jgi:membrane protein implicated in regulation of membrane protease activity
MISTLLTLLVLGVIGLVVLSVVLTVFGLAVGLASFLLFKVAPIVLVGYVVMRLLSPKRKRISEADRRWLEDK